MYKYIKETLKQAAKAYMNNEVPVGSIIIKNDKIIARGYNKTQKYNTTINHSEIIAIKKAQTKLNNWRLNDCVLFTSLEPCVMCSGAIINSRIKKIYFFTKSDFITPEERNALMLIYKKNKVDIVQLDDEDKSKKLLNDFFKEKRKIK